MAWPRCNFLEVCIKGQNRSIIFWKLSTDRAKLSTGPCELSIVSVDGAGRLHDRLSSFAMKKLGHVTRANGGRTACILVVSSMFPSPISISLVYYEGFGWLGFMWACIYIGIWKKTRRTFGLVLCEISLNPRLVFLPIPKLTKALNHCFQSMLFVNSIN